MRGWGFRLWGSRGDDTIEADTLQRCITPAPHCTTNTTKEWERSDLVGLLDLDAS